MTASDKQVDRIVARATAQDPVAARLHAVLRSFRNAGNDPDGYARDLLALSALLER
ncbi:hypothetical protein G7070_12470 [Propioniciclava coleopterorum]|uniref:Uncharacterized protein n=1 Tax=Propioniciclava coleopterorum TaxID=2714937 RepID=A0A6G7Y8H3_9ACTN|nr:hypothetical protein [Propioniciclava coleopterorum]QIK72931.1 hypothetical protein G7070_12470 [Propioniciclava coleopterorum]